MVFIWALSWYCIAALPAARTVPTAFSPVLTVFGAMLLSVACVAWLLFFISHIARSISVNYIVDRIARETERMIEAMMPNHRKTNNMPASFIDEASQWDAPVLSMVSGYVRTIDVTQLIAIAKANRLSIHIFASCRTLCASRCANTNYIQSKAAHRRIE